MATTETNSMYTVQAERGVNAIIVDKNGKASKQARAMIQYAEDMSEPYEIKKEYPVHRNDGALAFMRAVGVVFGTELTGKAIPPSFFSSGQKPQIESIEIQALIYKAPNGQVFAIERGVIPARWWSSIVFLETMKIDAIVSLCDDAGVATKRHYSDSDRQEIINTLIKASEIVDTYMVDRQVLVGYVKIFNREGDDFGVATIGENEENHNFTLEITAHKEETDTVDALIKETEHQFEVGSIYKGRAYDFNDQTFFTPSPTVKDALILTADQERLIKGLALHRISFVERIKQIKPDLAKATILLPGDYGTGKTMCNMAVAWYAITKGWSVVRWIPAKDDKKDFGRMLRFASRLGPVLIIIEDVEKMITSDENQFSVLLDDLDGATTKVSNVVTLMTTNFPERIPRAVWRRFHGVVKFGPLDEVGITRMIKVQLGESWEGFDPNEDISSTLYNIPLVQVERGKNRSLKEIVKMLHEYGFNQWLISQVLARAMVFSLNQSNTPLCITEQDMLDAAESLLPQYDLYREADHGPGAKRTLEDAFKELLALVITEHQIDKDTMHLIPVSK